MTTDAGATRVQSVLGGETMAGRKRPDKDQVARINASLASYERALSPAPTPITVLPPTTAQSGQSE